EEQDADPDEDPEPAPRKLGPPARDQHRTEERESGEDRGHDDDRGLVPRREPEQQHDGTLRRGGAAWRGLFDARFRRPDWPRRERPEVEPLVRERAQRGPQERPEVPDP